MFLANLLFKQHLVATKVLMTWLHPAGRLCKQRDLAYKLMMEIPGVSCVKPSAAMYLFFKLDPKLYPIENDQDFILDVLKKKKVLMVQGTGFNWHDQ